MSNGGFSFTMFLVAIKTSTRCTFFFATIYRHNVLLVHLINIATEIEYRIFVLGYELISYTVIKVLFLYFNLFIGVIVGSFPKSFTSIPI